MAAINHVAEVTSAVPPAKLFKALALDDVILKALPELITSVETLEGDGGPGTIKLTTLGGAFIKQRIDAIDLDQLIFSYTIIEGLALTEHVESVSYEVKFSASADGGSITKITSTFHPKADAQISPEEVSFGSAKAVEIIQAVGGYLSAHPDA